MQRRVQQANGHRKAAHNCKELPKILPLHGQDFGKCLAAPAQIIRDNHLAHCQNAIVGEEHMFGTAETDTFRTELARNAGILWCFSVGAHFHASHLVRPLHQFAKIT